MMVKEDSLAELEKAAVDKLELLREEAGDVVEEVGEWIGEFAYGAYDDAREKMDGLRGLEEGKVSFALQREKEDLGRERGWLGWEREVLERDRRKFEARAPQAGGKNCRAGSAPL